MFEGLNEQQTLAAQAIEGPVMVFAGAGSGKTRTLTYRIISMVMEKHINPYNILAITFTNKAVNEMKERIKAYVDANTNALTICTFHSLCARILRKDIGLLGYSRSFSIIDEEDQLKVIADILKSESLDRKQARHIQKEINYAKCFDVSPKEPLVRNIYNKYEEKIKSMDMIDFEDLLIKVYELFSNYPEVLERYQDRFQYILVDEFQDTNLIQYKIVKLLAKKYQNIFVVGDDDQSIYSFRGTNYENINLFKRDFPDFEQFELTQNYRSTQYILQSANRLIAHNKNRHPKELFSDRVGASDDVVVYQARDERDETDYIIERIFDLKSARNEYRDFAILYRSSAILRNIELGLIKAGLPYKVYGGMSYLRRREIKDVIAYFKLIISDHDLISFKRVVNVPSRGIGNATIEKIEDLRKEKHLSIFEAIDWSKEILPKSKYLQLLSFKELIFKYREKINEVNLIQLFEELLLEIDYYKYLEEESDSKDEYEDRVANISEFKSILWDVENGGDLNIPRVERLKDAFDTAILSDEYLQNQKENPLGITISTIHSVKGLEYKYVFIAGFEENIFPNNFRVSSDSELEEERRIAYVAITRAKDKLFMISAKQRLLYGGFVKNEPSRFLMEAIGANRCFNDFIDIDVSDDKILIEPKKTSNNNFISMDKKGDSDYETGNLVIHKAFGEGIILSIKDGIGSIFFNNDKVTRKILLNHPALTKK